VAAPCSCEETAVYARDAQVLQKVAKEDFAQVLLHQWLQRLHGLGSLKRKEGAVVVHRHVHVARLRVQVFAKVREVLVAAARV